MARGRRTAEAPAPPPLRLVASATRTLKFGDTTKAPPKAEWQAEAWDYFDSVPEVKQTVIYLGNAMAKLRLYVAVRPEPSDQPIPVADATTGTPAEGDQPAVPPAVVLPPQLVADAEAELARLHGPTGGQGDILRAVNANLEVAGEAYLVGYGERTTTRTDPATLLTTTVKTPERWEVRSVSEVEFKRPPRLGEPPEVVIHDAPKDVGTALDPEQDAVIRLWQPHPRFKSWADCSLKGGLNDCAVLKVLAQQAIGEGWSHLNAGFMCAPNGLSFGPALQPNGDPVPEGDNDDTDPFTRKLMDYLTAPMRDPASAAAVVPALIRGAAEDLKPDVLRWLDIGRGRAEFINAAVEAKAIRLARALNVPPEVMLGHQQTTFANAEQVDQDTFDDYLKPRAELICEALTSQYLRVPLVEKYDPADVERLIVWYDATELLSGADPADTVEAAHQDGLISDAARRRIQGFDEADAPTMEERLLNTALRRGIFTADLTVALLNAGGVEGIDVAAVVSELTEAEADATDAGDDALAAAVRVLRESPALVAVLAAAAGHAAERPEGRRHPFAIALPAAATTRADPPGRRLLDIDRQLRERLIGAADAAMTRALERAGNKIKGQVSASARGTLRGVTPRYAAATLGRPAILAAFSEAELLEGAWVNLRNQFLAWGETAQGEALDVVSNVVGGFSRAERDHLQLRQAADLTEAWGWFEEALTSVAGDRLFDPDPAAPLDGEYDPTLKVPTGMVRQAIARVGGAAGLERVEGAWVALTDGGTRPAGGIGTGQLMRDALRDKGAGVDGYRWHYGPAQRSRPFMPHAALDGTTFVSFTDPVLRNGSGFPPFAYYLPGDHMGCVCDVEPDIVPPGRSPAKKGTGKAPAPKFETEPEVPEPGYLTSQRDNVAKAREKLAQLEAEGADPKAIANARHVLERQEGHLAEFEKLWAKERKATLARMGAEAEARTPEAINAKLAKLGVDQDSALGDYLRAHPRGADAVEVHHKGGEVDGFFGLDEIGPAINGALRDQPAGVRRLLAERGVVIRATSEPTLKGIPEIADRMKARPKALGGQTVGDSAIGLHVRELEGVYAANSRELHRTLRHELGHSVSRQTNLTHHGLSSTAEQRSNQPGTPGIMSGRSWAEVWMKVDGDSPNMWSYVSSSRNPGGFGVGLEEGWAEAWAQWTSGGTKANRITALRKLFGKDAKAAASNAQAVDRWFTQLAEQVESGVSPIP